jgi:hypothetical protein
MDQCFSLLRLKGHWLLYFDDWRGAPSSYQCLAPRSIEAHRQIERSLWCRHPVGILVGARAFVLEIEIEGAVRVKAEQLLTAKRLSGLCGR